ncbi:histidine phosphatase family protein [Phycicoccus avicenniae]|uniref:histidine phosphatase family protein n=1 Tax=Phycicoccus avicenniae TaxID=2828860 RepID=UPI003D2DECCB
MADLHCPARVVLARHGEAEYETGLTTDDGGCLTVVGRQQARALGEALRDENVARVWCSPLSRAVQTAEIAAGVLGVDVVVREGLREYGVGAIAGTDADEADSIGPVFAAWVAGDDSARIPGGERIADVVARVRTVLEEVADAHRGETVLVVSHGGAVMATVPELVGAPRARAHDLVLPGGGHLVLESDEDGWRRLPTLRPGRAARG